VCLAGQKELSRRAGINHKTRMHDKKNMGQVKYEEKEDLGGKCCTRCTKKGPPMPEKKKRFRVRGRRGR